MRFCLPFQGEKVRTDVNDPKVDCCLHVLYYVFTVAQTSGSERDTRDDSPVV
jgi:hypothetical protein